MSSTFDPESVDKAPEPAGPAPEFVGPAPEFVGPSSSPPSLPSPSHPGRRLAAIGLVGGLVLGSLGGGAVGASLLAHNQRPAASPPATTTTLVAAPSTVPGSVAAIYKQAIPGVVTISATVGTPRSFSQATGTGFVVDTSGDILTNAHVVDGASSVTVTFSDGQSVSGRVAGVDQSDDLAIVKVSLSADQLHPLTLGNSDALQIGDTALAIGAPFGLSGSLTEGIVSGLNRGTSAPNGRALTGMIQTDAPINPGNSGGPLLDGNGAVVGINDSIESPVQGSVGVGFAIPINTAKRVLVALEQGQAIQHPALGISGESITPGLATQLGLSVRSGVLVTTVLPGSPAEKAGLQATGSPDASDDIITAIDGHAITSIEGLTSYLNTRQVGDKVTLSINRGGRQLSISVTLGNFQPQTNQ
ncbi:MAG: PDZ domain-containing protein [Chloroflexi bacterium]|nr:MAG: PDZ domain-containing protein [Chloroflexota bacterium]